MTRSTLPTSAAAFVITVAVGTALAVLYQNTLRETVNELDTCKSKILRIFDDIAKVRDPTDAADVYGAAMFKQLRPFFENELDTLQGPQGLKRCQAIFELQSQPVSSTTPTI